MLTSTITFIGSSHQNTDTVTQTQNDAVTQPRNLGEVSVSIESEKISDSIHKITAHTEGLIPEGDVLAIVDNTTRKMLNICDSDKCFIEVNSSEYPSLYAQIGDKKSDVITLTNELALSNIDAVVQNFQKNTIFSRSAENENEEPTVSLSTNKSEIEVDTSAALSFTKQNIPDGYGTYLFNITENLPLNNGFSCPFCDTYGVSFETGAKYRTFKVFIASAENYLDVKKQSDLVDIIGSSNEISIHRKEWTLDIKDNAYMSTDNNYMGYMQPITNQNIDHASYGFYWHDPVNGVWRGNRSPTGSNDHGWSLAPGQSLIVEGYVAKPISDDYGRVQGVTDVQASAVKVVSNPIINSPQNARGGSNASVDCNQSCEADPVNAYTGEYWDSKEDLANISSTGPSLNFIRTYSSFQREEQNSVMGPGWTHNWNMKIVPDSNYIDTNPLSEKGSLRVIQENGSQLNLAKWQDGKYFSSEKANANLEYNTETEIFTFVRHKKQFFEFNKDGVLTKTYDLNGNYINVSYLNGRINHLENNFGQFINIEWTVNNKRIQKVSNSAGKETVYDYLAEDWLWGITDVNGNHESFEFERGLITGIIHPDNSYVTNRYENYGQVFLQTDEKTK